ncbi:MAG: hypothetical protein QM500_20945 [Methylococcales bacterium]
MNKYLKIIIVINFIAIGVYGSTIFVHTIPKPIESKKIIISEAPTKDQFYQYKLIGHSDAVRKSNEIILLLSLVIFINSVTLIYVVKNNSKQNT